MKNRTCFTSLTAIFLCFVMMLSACSKESPQREAGNIHENMVKEYQAEAIDIPQGIGKPKGFCVSDDSAYVIGEGTAGNFIAKFSMADNAWEEIGGLDRKYEPVAVSYYESLWVLLQDESGRLAVCRLKDGSVSAAKELDIKKENPIGGVYAYPEGLLIWTYTEIYLFNPATGDIIKGKTLNSSIINGILARNGEIFAQINKTGANALFKLEDLFSGSDNHYPLENMVALTPLCASSQDHLLLGNIDYLYAFKSGEGEIRKLFSWPDMGCLLPDYVTAAFELSDENIYCINYSEAQLLKITANIIPKRTTITIATGICTPLLNHIIYKFNQSSAEYKLENIIYAPKEIDRLRVEIIAGKGPDIIDTSCISIDAESSGFFENLMPYIEKDKEISEEDFISSVFEASKTDGALYRLVPYFSIDTVVTLDGDKNETGSFDEYIKNYMSGKNGSSSVCGAPDILQMAFPLIQKDVLRNENGSTKVDVPRLKEWLAFCSKAPELNVSPQNIMNCVWPVTLSKKMGGELSYIGWPGKKGGSSCATAEFYCFAMLSTGACKDAAWSVLRQLLLPEYQDVLAEAGFFFPLRTDSLEKSFEELKKDTELGFTEKDADKLRNLINSVDAVRFNDDTLYNLVSSEAESFFSGGKSLDEAAALIESKLNIYLAEHS